MTALPSAHVRVIRALSPALAALALVGCLASPLDGSQIPDKSTRIPLSGYAISPNEWVDVQAQRQPNNG